MRNSKNLLIIALLWACLTAGASDFRLDNGHVSITYNTLLQRRIQWKAQEEGSIVAFDPAAQEGVEIFGLLYNAFRMDSSRTSQQRVVDSEFGPAMEATVTGTYDDLQRGVRLERQVRVLLPDKFPDAALFQCTYKNRGQLTLRLDKVWSQSMLLDRRLADPSEESWALASFQGGAYKWGADYSLIWLRPGFRQSNFQGVDDVRGGEGIGGGMPFVYRLTSAEGAGGGMPFVDAWAPSMGVAVAHLERAPQWLSLPVEVRPEGRVQLAITESPQAKFGQQEWLKPNESFQTVLSAIIFHRLDFHDALRVYGQLLRCRGVAIPETSSPSAYEPRWASWGWERDFTLEKFLGVLPELESMGIRAVLLDDGWYDYIGDWNLNRSPGKFPGSVSDMIAFVRKVHEQGFRIGLWWYPLGASSDSRLARERRDLLIQDESGSYTLDVKNLHQLCPAYEPALAYLNGVLTRAVSVWGFDGVYTDFGGLSSVPPCFNKTHHHQSSLESFRSLPRLYQMIHHTLRELKEAPYNEVCICSLPHSPYFMPYYDTASASDPGDTARMRRRVKAEKAIRGGTFCVGDGYQEPIDAWMGAGVPEAFESAIGTGAHLTTFYANLDDRQRTVWTRWFQEYKVLGLSRAEYINLYDLAFDTPEVHVVRKGREMYFGIFAEEWPHRRRIELRGLDKGVDYEVYDYANRRQLGTLKGADPYLKVGFKGSLLLRLRPVNHE